MWKKPTMNKVFWPVARSFDEVKNSRHTVSTPEYYHSDLFIRKKYKDSTSKWNNDFAGVH